MQQEPGSRKQKREATREEREPVTADAGLQGSEERRAECWLSAPVKNHTAGQRQGHRPVGDTALSLQQHRAERSRWEPEARPWSAQLCRETPRRQAGSLTHTHLTTAPHPKCPEYSGNPQCRQSPITSVL